MKVPLLDLKMQYRSIKEEIKSATDEVFESQWFIGGPKVEEFEEVMTKYCGCKYAVGVSSGSDALLISLMTAGIKTGDLVITTPYTFFATVGAVVRLGAKPLFVDIDEYTYNIDPEKIDELTASLDEGQRSGLKAIIPVHLYGQCADMEPILKTADDFNLIVIEDAAQAIGAEYGFSDGIVKRAGSMGDFGCFSFFPAKNLGAYGDAGIVTTNDREIYDRLKIMRNHGSHPKYYNRLVGGNFRLDALQASILKVKQKYLDQWSEGRKRKADFYRELFQNADLDDIVLPVEREVRHIYNYYVIKVGKRRDELREYLRANGIGCEIYYPLSLHEQKCFEYLNYRPGDFPVSEEAAKSTLALPIYPELTIDQQKYVVDTIKEFYKGK